MGIERTVSDEELSEYIDGRLDDGRRAFVRQQLDEDADLARRYATMLEQDRVLSQLGAEILDEPIPERLAEILRPKPDRPVIRRFPKPHPMIAFALALSGACVFGWLGYAALDDGARPLRPAAGGSWSPVLQPETISQARVPHLQT
jgi:anti-sigma factor RsiW